MTELFETFNLKKFGEYLYKLRKSLFYTQNDVVKLSGISKDTLRRIERGEVLLRYDTLILLSQAYKKDLLLDLKNYAKSDIIFHYYKRLDNLILKADRDKLLDLKKDFNDFTQIIQHEDFVIPVIREQFELLLEGVSIYYSAKSDDCIEYFLRALNKTNPGIELNNFDAFKYTHFELHILLFIGLALAKQNNITDSNSLLHKCLDHCNFDYESTFNEKLFIVKIYMNLAYNAHLSDDHYGALKYADIGIEFCSNNHINYMMSLLLFRKGIAEFSLGVPNYIFSVKLSVSMLLATNDKELADTYIDALISKYGIVINTQELYFITPMNKVIEG